MAVIAWSRSTSRPGSHDTRHWPYWSFGLTGSAWCGMEPLRMWRSVISSDPSALETVPIGQPSWLVSVGGVLNRASVTAGPAFPAVPARTATTRARCAARRSHGTHISRGCRQPRDVSCAGWAVSHSANTARPSSVRSTSSPRSMSLGSVDSRPARSRSPSPRFSACSNTPPRWSNRPWVGSPRVMNSKSRSVETSRSIRCRNSVHFRSSMSSALSVLVSNRGLPLRPTVTALAVEAGGVAVLQALDALHPLRRRRLLLAGHVAPPRGCGWGRTDDRPQVGSVDLEPVAASRLAQERDEVVTERLGVLATLGDVPLVQAERRLALLLGDVPPVIAATHLVDWDAGDLRTVPSEDPGHLGVVLTCAVADVAGVPMPVLVLPLRVVDAVLVGVWEAGHRNVLLRVEPHASGDQGFGEVAAAGEVASEVGVGVLLAPSAVVIALGTGAGVAVVTHGVLLGWSGGLGNARTRRALG